MRKLLLTLIAFFTVLSLHSKTVTDVLTAAKIGNTGTVYQQYTYKGESGAQYLLYCAGDKGSIQIREKNSDSGIVVTKSPGVVKSVSIVWNAGTSDSRVLNLYGSSTPYSSPSQLFKSSAELITTFQKSAGDKTYELTSKPSYIGMRSASGAMYISSISIVWEIESSDDSDINVTKITLSDTNLKLNVGQTHQLSASIQPTNATNKTVTWTTNNSSVATVSSNGLVTAKMEGTATITAKCGSVSASCSVVVTKNVEVTGITLSPTSMWLEEGENRELIPTVTPSNATDKTITWSSGNKSVATVSSKGIVTGVSAGTTTITAVCGSKSATCNVTVNKRITDSSETRNPSEFKFEDLAGIWYFQLGDYFNSDCSNQVLTVEYELSWTSTNKARFKNPAGLYSDIEAEYDSANRIFTIKSNLKQVQFSGDVFQVPFTYSNGIKTDANSVRASVDPASLKLTFSNGAGLRWEKILTDGHTENREYLLSGAYRAPLSNFVYEGMKYTVLDMNARTCRLVGFDNNIIGSTVNLNKNVINVRFPFKVTEIGGYAFWNCSKLKTITLPSDLKVIADFAFNNCTGLQSITIPANIKNIGESVFNGCTSLSSISLPAGLEKIGKEAFYGCIKLSTVNIPDNVNTIEEEAFRYSGITGVNIPSKVIKLSNYVFANCTSLANVTIPGNIRSIGDNAFDGCSNLKKVVMPATVISVGPSAFKNCKNLKTVDIASLASWLRIQFEDPESNPFNNHADLYINGKYYDTLNIPDGTEYISQYQFFGCNIKLLTLPASIKGLNPRCFDGCNSLKNIYCFAPKDVPWCYNVQIGTLLYGPFFADPSLYWSPENPTAPKMPEITLHVPKGMKAQYISRANNDATHFRQWTLMTILEDADQYNGNSGNDNDSEWQYWGIGSMKDGFMCNIFNNVKQQTFDITVEKSNKTPGVYRIVNPFKNWKSTVSGLTYKDNEENYMIIHCENSSYVWFEHFETGWYDGNYELYGFSQIAALLEGDWTMNEIKTTFPSAFGKLNNNTILVTPTFQYNGGTYFTLLGTYDFEEFYGSGTYSMSITLPGNSSVPENEMEYENNIVEVYNLNGIRVYNGDEENMSLEPGIYIVRKGSKTSKVYIR